MIQLQQGDVCFERASLPRGAKRVEQEGRRVIVAEGEATGHAHAIPKAEHIALYEHNGTLYLDLAKEGTVVHEEHKPITLPPGTYEIGIVKEVDPFSEEVRNVAD